MIGPSQPMKRCRPPRRATRSAPGLEHQVERVAEHHVEPELRDLARLEPSNGALGGQRDERGRAYVAVRGAHDTGARTRAGVGVADLERGHRDRLSWLACRDRRAIPTFELPDTRGGAHAAPLEEAPPGDRRGRDVQPLPLRGGLEPAPEGRSRRLWRPRGALPRHQRQRRQPLPGRLARPDARVRRLQRLALPLPLRREPGRRPGPGRTRDPARVRVRRRPAPRLPRRARRRPPGPGQDAAWLRTAIDAALRSEAVDPAVTGLAAAA